MSVFISYRRTDGLDTATEIYNLLSKDYRVFFDMESLRTGPFAKEIEKNIRECKDFIIILSPSVFDRINLPEDWINHELSLAFEDPQKNIIPIMLDGFSFKSITNYPKVVSQLFQYNALNWSKQSKLLTDCIHSNKHCCLNIIKKNKKLALSSDSIELLKTVYRNQINYKSFDIDISLHFMLNQDDFEDYICEYDVKHHSKEFAIYSAYDSFLRKKAHYTRYHPKAIELLIADQLNIKRHALPQEIDYPKELSELFVANSQVVHNYDIVKRWVIVIEEILKEYILTDSDRAYLYSNHHDIWESVDCTLHNYRDNKDWYFVSFRTIKNYAAKDSFPMYWAGSHILELTAGDYYTHILPDYYLSLASSPELTTDRRIMNLMNYSIGFH